MLVRGSFRLVCFIEGAALGVNRRVLFGLSRSDQAASQFRGQRFGSLQFVHLRFSGQVEGQLRAFAKVIQQPSC